MNYTHIKNEEFMVISVRPRPVKTSIKLVTELILFNFKCTQYFRSKIIGIYITPQLNIKYNTIM